jgi:hypothetical protein
MSTEELLAESLVRLAELKAQLDSLSHWEAGWYGFASGLVMTLSFGVWSWVREAVEDAAQ